MPFTTPRDATPLYTNWIPCRRSRAEGTSVQEEVMNEKLRRMMREIERRGGVIHVSETLPDAVAEAFLEQVLSCPDCCAAAHSESREAPTIDRVLGGVAIPNRFSRH